MVGLHGEQLKAEAIYVSNSITIEITNENKFARQDKKA
jgi:hypothetical protein